jgi:hypothetical protein
MISPERSRLGFTISYFRRSKNEPWTATAKKNPLLNDTIAKGAVTFSTAGWQGQTVDDMNHASIDVALPCDVRMHDPNLIVGPGVWAGIAEEAMKVADTRFRQEVSADAVIEHVGFDEV